MKDNRYNWLLYGLAILGSTLVIYKATTMSMTHDESASFYYINDKSVLFNLFRSDTWPNANNHWLNTLSFQFFSSIFGPEDWAIRLGNILLYVVYAYFSIQLLLPIKTNWLRVLGLVLMVFNPYLLDFFSTARGYGMSLGFTTMAFYCMLRYIVSEKLSHLAFASLGILLASLALFSSLIFLPVIYGILFIYLLIQNKDDLLSRRMIYPLLVMILFSIVTVGLTFIPIKALSGNAEFEWGSPHLLGCFQSLAFHSSYGKPYFPTSNLSVILFFGMMTYIFIQSTKFVRGLKTFVDNRHLVLSLTVFVLLIAVMVIARHTIGTYYPTERKTVMFVPFISMILSYFLDSLNVNFKKGLGMVLSVLFTIHFLSSFQHDQVREWWYDKDTKDFIQMIVDDADGKKLTIGCHWFFHPTLSFYSKTKYPNQAEIMNYNKDIDIDRIYDYFIVFDSELELLTPHYDIFYSNNSGRTILKRKEVD